jgi:hypothetical protein
MCGAALLLVPLGYLIEMVREGHSSEVIGGELKVRKELVELRWRLAIEFDEVGNFFDKATDKIIEAEAHDNNGIGGEVEFIGQPKVRKPIKTPIGEVKPYQPYRVSGKLEKPGDSYNIGDPVSLAFWDSIEGDINEVEFYDYD